MNYNKYIYGFFLTNATVGIAVAVNNSQRLSLAIHVVGFPLFLKSFIEAILVDIEQ